MNEGDVSIDLAGTPVTLRPLLSAAVALDREHGSFGKLLAELEVYNLSAATTVVLHGLGRPVAEMEATTADVFKSGLIELTPHLIRYVILLANGGRPMKAEEEPARGTRPLG